MLSLEGAANRVLFGESLASIRGALVEELIAREQLDADDEAVQQRTQRAAHPFLRDLCRHLGEKYGGNRRVAAALREWLRISDDYEAYDALLCAFEFDGRGKLLERGQLLFPGPLTAHWERR
jgi:hypothetical protein